MMWGHHQPFGFGWPQQWAQQNPTPQSTDPVEWAAKAAQWAQQRQTQEHYQHEQQIAQQQQQIQMQQQQHMQAAQQVYVGLQEHQAVATGTEFAPADGRMQGGAYMQQHQQPVVTESPLPPKPLFDGSPMQMGALHVGGPQTSQHGFEEHAEGPPDYFHGSPHMERREGEEGVHELRLPRSEHFPHPRGPHGVRPRGDFRAKMVERFRGPRGHLSPRFSPRGTPPFRPRIEENRSPHSQESRFASMHRGPTEEKFDRGTAHREDSHFESQDQENTFQRNLPHERQQGQHQGRYIEKLEAVKQQELEKERELKRELERMEAIERQRKLEMEKRLEMERKREEERKREMEEKRQEAERLKQLELERKRAEEEAIAKQTEKELEKKRQMDHQLAQEIENKKREMERMLEQKERMERELMEKQVELGRMGVGAGEFWTPGEKYPTDQQERPDQPTIPSWNRDPSVIPGLGELEGHTSASNKEDRTTEAEKAAQQYDSQSQGPPPAKKEDTTQMMESLGKIVSQLQTLQGLTSSLKLLQTMPKEGNTASASTGIGRQKEGERAAIREKELSEDTKRKVAALLANESDSDGEQEAKSKPRHEGETAATAREFDGTYNVQPKVYGTYAAEQYGKDHGGPPQHEGHEHGGPPMGRYSKFDYDPHEEERDLRGPYGGYPSREEYSRPPPRDTHIPEGDYSLPPSRDYPPLPGVRSRGMEDPGVRSRGMEEEERWRRRESTPPRVPARDFPPSGPPYGGTDYPPMRVRPPPHPDDYRGPPEQGESYYHRPPPPEPKRSAGIYTQMESIDYSHGGASNVYVKSVDYHHGSQPGGGYSSMAREMPPGVANFPYGSGGGYSAYGEGAAPGSYLPFGNPGGYTSGSGLDPAAIFAAYQGGEAKRRTLPLWLREELEKLERKKAKQLEKEAREGALRELEGRPRWAEELEQEREREGEREGETEWQGKWEREEEEEKEARENIRLYRRRSNSSTHSGEESPPHRKKRHYESPEESEEDKHLSLVMKIRQMLTVVLLEVTNQEIENVAMEAIEEAKKPKLVIQMKGVANLPSKENKHVLGLSVYSSDSESDSGNSPDVRDSKTRSREGSKSSSTSSKGSKSKGSKETAVSSKLPNPEQIAAAFKDTRGGVTGKEKSPFMPVPRIVQEKQKDSSKSSSSSSVKEKEREKTLSRESSRDKTKEKDRDKERKKTSEKDRESDRDSSSSSSRKKSSSSTSSSSKKDHDKERDRGRGRERGRERERGKDHSSGEGKRSPSSSSKSRKSSRHSSTSSKSKGRSSSQRSHSRSPPMSSRRSRSRSPVLRTPTRIVELAAAPGVTPVPTGKGSIRTTKGFVSSFQPAFPPIGVREVQTRSPSPPDTAYRLFRH